MSIVDPDNDTIVAEPKAPGANCAECPLQRFDMVPSFGPDKAEIALIGEAPGYEEVKQRRPFVGKSGQLLNRVLEFHGIDRDKVFVTNACLCHPPKNATPNQKAMDCCYGRLTKELEERGVKKIIATGAVGAKTILRTKEGIKNLRAGGPKDAPDVEAQVVPTFHPAAALRSPDLLPTIVGDIGKLKSIEVGWEPTKYKVVDDVGRAINMLRKQREFSRRLAIDVENDHTTGRPITDPEWLCIGVSHRPGAAVVYSEAVVNDPAFQAAFRKILADPDLEGTYHNGKSDTQKLWSFAPEARVAHDTMLAHYSTDERVGIHDLGNVASETIGAPDYKKEEKKLNTRKDGSLRGLPVDALHRYNATDTDVTHRIIDPLLEKIDADGVRYSYDNLLIPGAYALGRMEYAGVAVDMDFLDNLERIYEGRCKEKEAALREIADINPRSAQQIKKWCWDNGFKVKSTDKKVLAPYRNKHEFFARLSDYKSDQKMHSTYIKGLHKHIDSEGLVRCNYNLHTVETGRLSSSEPNMQNQPKQGDEQDYTLKLRNVFVPRPGYVFLHADYAQIEYRMAGILSGDEWLLEQFRQNRKFHHEVAAALFGPDFTAKQYTHAKTVNFRILYGGEANGLAQDIGVVPQKAQKMIDDWFARVPKVKAMMDYIEETIKEHGELMSPFARKRRFWFWTAETWKDVVREGYNFPLQSTASDLNLTALIRLVPLLEGKARPVITVHDSLTFEVKVEYLQEVAHTIKAVMEDTPFNDICPILVDLSIGDRWGIEEEFTLEAA